MYSSAKLIRSVEVYFSPDGLYPSAYPEWSGGSITDISFQSGSEGNIFLPAVYFEASLRIYDARRPQIVSALWAVVFSFIKL